MQRLQEVETERAAALAVYAKARREVQGQTDSDVGAAGESRLGECEDQACSIMPRGCFLGRRPRSVKGEGSDANSRCERPREAKDGK